MLDALGIDDLDAFNAHVAELIARYAENEDVKLEISNSIWLNKEYPGAQNAKFQDGFVKLLTDYYAAEADTVTNADAAQRINGWIEQKTNGKIKNVIQDADFLSALVTRSTLRAHGASSLRRTQQRRTHLRAVTEAKKNLIS